MISGHSEFIPVFLGKIVRKIWNDHFWPFQIYTSLFGEILSEKIWNSNFWPFLIYTSLFWIKLSGNNLEQIIFGHSEFIPVFLGNIVRKNLEQWFLAILNLYQSFWEKLSEKFGMTIFGHSKFIPVFLEKMSEKIRKSNFWQFLTYTSLFGENCQK